jgi:hypothetical protein
MMNSFFHLLGPDSIFRVGWACPLGHQFSSPHSIILAFIVSLAVRTSLQIRWYLSGRNMTPQEETGRESRGHANHA